MAVRNLGGGHLEATGTYVYNRDIVPAVIRCGNNRMMVYVEHPFRVRGKLIYGLKWWVWKAPSYTKSLYAILLMLEDAVLDDHVLSLLHFRMTILRPGDDGWVEFNWHAHAKERNLAKGINRSPGKESS